MSEDVGLELVADEHPTFPVRQADGGLIEQVCEQGDGKFKEGAWVKISEECSGIPSFMPNLKGMYGKLTQK